MKIRHQGRRSLPIEGQEGEQPQAKSRGVAALILVAALLVATFVFIVPKVPTLLKDGSSILSQLTSPITGTSQSSSTSTTSYTLYSPLIEKGTANISYPSDYSALAAYALGLINQDRAASSLGAVTLSPSQAGQQHADSMLQYGYFSHFDTQGLKPYMRYSLLGGKGAVEENVAFIYNYPPRFTTTSSVEDAIKSLEYSMMYNDSACCQNGHRENILTALHNKVSIGVAYNGTAVYFVEDFENYYISLNFSVSNTKYVTMTGAPLKSGLSAKSIYVTYDPTPSSETPSQLNSGPREYGPGNLTGGVLPPCILACPSFEQGITVYADTWTPTPWSTSTQLTISFSLHDFIQRYRAGVYTIYLITGSDTTSAITSISVFVA